MTTDKDIDRDLKIFMYIAQAVAIEEAKYMAMTPEIERDAQELAAFTREHLAAIRRAELERRPSNIVSGAIRPSILAMARDKVIASLKELFVRHPQLQFCYREFEQATDEDLRSALEDALSLMGE
jgi:hypothetical protein